MEEIGLQFESEQDRVIDAVRQYVSQGGHRLIEECPLRRGMALLRAKPVLAPAQRPGNAKNASRSPWQTSHLAAIFENYFDFYFRASPRRAVVVGPRVGRWTGVLHDEKAIDCGLLRWVAGQLNCRAVGYCFVEGEEYSYIELTGSRITEVYSSFLADGSGLSFWSAANGDPPEPGSWITDGFLKTRYQFIPGFYDQPYLRGERSQYACYRYDALPDLYEEKDNYPLDAFRYFYFHCDKE
jgi:hypothetical protein